MAVEQATPFGAQLSVAGRNAAAIGQFAQSVLAQRAFLYAQAQRRQIKTDEMFVDAFGTDRNSTTTVETLVDLARTMLVVAEGVENLSKSCTCTRLGCVRNKTMYLHHHSQ